MQAAPAQPGAPQAVEAGFYAPESLTPAIETYLGCLGPTMQGISRKAGPQFTDGMRKVIDQTLERCAPSRAKARRMALRLIEDDRKVSAADREATVDHTLGEIDAVFRRMPDQLPPEGKPEAEKARP
ncbi:hypothetical protein J2W22_001401 [Sphingomonas kyeonggiensis]|nr:hypothetical protein [Sphingomonas kyeonggiensis]